MTGGGDRAAVAQGLVHRTGRAVLTRAADHGDCRFLARRRPTNLCPAARAPHGQNARPAPRPGHQRGGAGSNGRVAHLYNVAPKDGTFIGAPQKNAFMDALSTASLGNARRLRHDATKLSHIGSPPRSLCLHRALGCAGQSFQAGLTQELLIRRDQPRHLDPATIRHAQQHHRAK